MISKRMIVMALTCVLTSTSMMGCKSVSDKEDVKPNSVKEDVVGDVNNQNGENLSDVPYVTKLFDQSYVHEINIEISEEDYEDLVKNPLNKTKYQVNVSIDGESVNDVSFSTKGNTSLSGVSNTDSDKYSFKINFGKFIDGQTYHGLDKLNLNNIYADATYMKDFLSYRIMEEAGAAAPLTSFVSVSINGEPHGLYLAIEEVGDSFLERTYGSTYGELYKPETEALEQMGNVGENVFGKLDQKTPIFDEELQKVQEEANELIGDNIEKEATQSEGEKEATNGGVQPPNSEGNPPQMPNGNGSLPQMPNSNENPPQMPNGEGNPPNMPNGNGNPPQMPNGNSMNRVPGFPGGGEGFGSTSAGANLAYTDDNIDSYRDIFDNAETKVEDEDKKRVVEALKKLSTGENLEECIDVDAVIRYFVAHNFVLNFDSYTGNMLHNYYLYEENGILSVLPWDYNLAFGAFSMPGIRGGVGNEADNNASTLVNYPIDTPLFGVASEDRPLWNAIVSNEEYMKLYHQYFDEFVTNYFETGEFVTELDRVYNMLRPYVEKDTSGFYSVEEFDQGYETMKMFCELRAESIRKQLTGEIPATQDGQNADGVKLVDASTITIADMGSQNGIQGDMGGNRRPMGMQSDGDSNKKE